MSKKTKDKKPTVSLQETIDYLKKKYRFRYNQVTTQVEVRFPNKPTYTAMDDYALNSIAVRANIDGHKINKADLDMVLYSDQIVAYDPFNQYFNKLPKVTGTGHINQLIASVCTHNDGLFAMCFTKWIVAV